MRAVPQIDGTTGAVTLKGDTQEAVEHAERMLEATIADPETGKIYRGCRVTQVRPCRVAGGGRLGNRATLLLVWGARSRVQPCVPAPLAAAAAASRGRAAACPPARATGHALWRLCRGAA